MKTAIKTVVPQPGKTLPASEFNGRNRVPNGVWIPGSSNEELATFFDVPVAIYKKIIFRQFFLLSVI